MRNKDHLGTFSKDSNNSYKIFFNNLLSIIIVYILVIIININNIIYYIKNTSFLLIIYLFIYLICIFMNKKRISLSNFIINNFYLPKLIIISLFLPKNVNYISILIIIILLFLIYLLINRYIKINYSILFLLLCMLWNINIIFIV